MVKFHDESSELDRLKYLKHFDPADLVMCGAGYYLGRQTIAVDAFCNRLVKAWPELPEHVRDYVQRIVEFEFNKEAVNRHWDLGFNPFGADCDRESWLKVRACWAANQEAGR